MKDSNRIPLMVHPLGKAWDQPDTAGIRLTDEFAYMSEDTFRQLLEYSTSIPSGVYEGKMWKAHNFKKDEWYLRWFAESEKKDHCSIQQRIIRTVEAVNHPNGS